MCLSLTPWTDQLTNNRMNQRELYVELGGVIATRRKRLGMTQAEAAKQAGMSRAALANIEVGRQNLLVHQLYSLSSALKLDSPAKLLPVGALERTVNVSEVSISEASLSDRQRAQVEHVFLSAQTSKRTDGDS